MFSLSPYAEDAGGGIHHIDDHERLILSVGSNAATVDREAQALGSPDMII